EPGESTLAALGEWIKRTVKSKVAALTLAALLAGFLGSIGTATVMLKWWGDIDEKITKRIDEKTTDALKDLKTKKDEIEKENELLRVAIECEHLMSIAYCAGDFDSAVVIFNDFSRRYPIDKIPESIRVSLLEQRIKSLTSSGRFTTISKDDLQASVRTME